MADPSSSMDGGDDSLGLPSDMAQLRVSHSPSVAPVAPHSRKRAAPPSPSTSDDEKHPQASPPSPRSPPPQPIALIISRVHNPSQYSDTYLLATTIRELLPAATEAKLRPFGSIRVILPSSADRASVLQKFRDSPAWLQSSFGQSVTLSLPRTPLHTVAVTRVPSQLTAEKVQQELPRIRDLPPVSHIAFRGSGVRKTLILGFSTPDDRDRVLRRGKLPLYMQMYTVERPHTRGHIQCFKCQHYFHTTVTCSSPHDICRKCAGRHRSSQCTSSFLKCTLCGGTHSASSLECPKHPDNLRSRRNRPIQRPPSPQSHVSLPPVSSSQPSRLNAPARVHHRSPWQPVPAVSAPKSPSPPASSSSSSPPARHRPRPATPSSLDEASKLFESSKFLQQILQSAVESAVTQAVKRVETEFLSKARSELKSALNTVTSRLLDAGHYTAIRSVAVADAGKGECPPAGELDALIYHTFVKASQRIPPDKPSSSKSPKSSHSSKSSKSSKSSEPSKKPRNG